MFDLFPAPVLFVPSCLYFLALLLPAGRNRAIQGAAVAGALGFILMSILVGILPALASLGAGLAFGVLIGLLRAGSATTTLALMVAIGTLPVGGWPYPFAGFLLAGAVAAFRLHREKGRGYLTMVTGETIAALGIQGAMPGKPDLSRLQINPDEANSPEEESVPAPIKKAAPIRLPGYMLVANLVGATVCLMAV